MIRMTVSKEDVKQRILTMPGPFCSCKRVYNSYSSSSRPSPKLTEDCMKELDNESLGSMKKVQKSTFFFKVLPSTLVHSEHQLGAFNLSLEQYKEHFLQNDDLLPSSQKEKMLENHPHEAELRVYLLAEGVDM